MQFEEIKQQIDAYQSQGKRMFLTSSFQTHSIPLLHMISRIDNSIPVVFINTGYHFPETIAFRKEVASNLGLNLVDLRSEIPRINQKGMDGRLMFASDPDRCCYINKTQPIDAWLMTHDVWINGVRAEQSAARNAMKKEQKAPHDTIRFHPLLDWTSKMIFGYKKTFELPEHPLEQSGYLSIGCEPCTRKIDPDMLEREARWYGLNKVECGLHSELIEN